MGGYSFLGVLGWFNHNLFATQGVYPARHGCEQMAALHFSSEDQVLRFPTTLYVSVPGLNGESKKARPGTMGTDGGQTAGISSERPSCCKWQRRRRIGASTPASSHGCGSAPTTS